MCAAPEQAAALPATVDLGRDTVFAGRVLDGDGVPVAGAFVRLLDATGEFTAEVVSSATGDFRFFAAPGSWTLRALHRSGTGGSAVSAAGAGLHTVEVVLG